MALKKKIIIGGIVITVAVGLTIFLVLFLGKQGPFFEWNTTALIDQEFLKMLLSALKLDRYPEREVKSADFWTEAQKIKQSEEHTYKQWYVRCVGKGDSHTVVWYGSKNKEPANEDNIEETIRQAKLFAWTIMKVPLFSQKPPNWEFSYDLQDPDVRDSTWVKIMLTFRLGR